MNTMTQETQTVPMARALGRCAGRVMQASRSEKLLTAGIATGLLALLGLITFVAGSSTPKSPKAAPNSSIKVADVVHQQGPRSYRMVPFTVTKGGMVQVEVQVSYDGEADLFVVPGWQRANVYATLETPLWGPGYEDYPAFSANDIAGTKAIQAHLEAGDYCAVLINRNWINGIETRTAVIQNPRF